MATKSETQSGKAWDKASSTFAKIIDLTNPDSVSSVTNRKIFEAVEATLPLSKASYLIDMGSGTGPVITGVLSPEHATQVPEDARLVAADTSASFIAMIEQTKKDHVAKGDAIWERLEVKLWDGRELQDVVGSNEVSHLLSSFCYFTMVDEAKGLSEALRVLKSGGLFVSTSMGSTEWGDLQHLLEKVRPEAKVPGVPKHWGTKPLVEEHMSKFGFANVRAEEYEMAIPFDSCGAAADFVISSFPALQSHLEAMSDDEKAQVRSVMVDHLKHKHPTDPIRLTGTSVICVATK